MTDKDSFIKRIKKEFDQGKESAVKSIEDSEGSYQGTPFYERTNPVFAWLIVVAAFLAGGLFAGANVSAGHGLWFLIGGSMLALPFWALLTESGMNWLNNPESYKKDNHNNTQSVTVDSSSQKEEVCSACGWKKPEK